MLLSFIKNHIYLFLLFLTITEGPITTFISAGFSAQGYLRFEYVAIIAFFGDLIGDIMLYLLGRFSRKLKFLNKYKTFSKQKDALNKWLEKKPFLYFLIVKFTPYLATPSLIFAGSKKFKFSKFLFFSFIISILVKISYLLLGYLGSISVVEFSKFLNGWKQVVLFIIFGVVLFYIVRKSYIHIGKKLKKK